MIYFQQDNGMEIRSDMWQCVFPTCLFVLLALIPVYAILCLLSPAYFPSKEHLEIITWSARFRDMVILLLPGMVGLQVWLVYMYTGAQSNIDYISIVKGLVNQTDSAMPL